MNRYIVTYGIAYVEERDGRIEAIASVPDVSSKREVVEKLVRLCNEHKLSPEHLKDMVEDISE